MTNSQKSMPFGTTEPGDDIVRIELDLVSASSLGGTQISAYTAFKNAYSAAPKVIGCNLRSGATNGSVSAQADATGVTLYAQAISDGSFPVGNVAVEATLRGALA